MEALTLKVLNFWEFTQKMEWVDIVQLLQLKTLIVGHGGCSAGSYLADPTSTIPSYWAEIILFKSVPVHQWSWLALLEIY